MAISTWVYDTSTGRFLRGGFYEPDFDPKTEGLAMFVDEHPDPATERYDAGSETQRRPLSADELAVDRQSRAGVVAQQTTDGLIVQAVIKAFATRLAPVLKVDVAALEADLNLEVSAQIAAVLAVEPTP